MKKQCNQCGQQLELGVGIQNTNIAFLVLQNKKMYENDDRIIRICTQPSCPNYGILQIPAQDMPNSNKYNLK